MPKSSSFAFGVAAIEPKPPPSSCFELKARHDVLLRCLAEDCRWVEGELEGVGSGHPFDFAMEATLSGRFSLGGGELEVVGSGHPLDRFEAGNPGAGLGTLSILRWKLCAKSCSPKIG